MTERIALVISATDLHGTAFNPVQANQYKFECVELRRPVVSNERDSGRTLGGRGYSHLLHTTKIHSPVISTNEITSAIATFLESFWDANFKFISLYTSGVWGNYIEVLTDSGDFPISFVDDLEDLPEVALTLTEAR